MICLNQPVKSENQIPFGKNISVKKFMKNKLANKILFAAIFAAMALAFSSTANFGLTINAGSANANTNSEAAAQATPKPSATAARSLPPAALVADLYYKHDAQKGPFFQIKDRALVDRYFTRATADLIWKDATDSKGEVSALEADPLYDAQDTKIKNFKVGEAKVTGKTATVPVTFANFGRKQTIIYALVLENGNWKIEDIKYTNGSSLLKIFKEDSAATSSAADSEQGEFEGKYQIGDTTCTVKPIKMAFEVKWKNGKGTEIFFSQDRADDKYIFASNPKTGKANVFSFDDENYNTGKFQRADGKEFPVKRIK